MGDRNRNCRLPDATGADDRNKLLLGKLRLNSCNGLFAANHALQTGGQTCSPGRLKFACLQGRRRYRNDEAVPAPRHVGDIPPAGVALSQGLAQRRNVHAKANLVGALLWPDALNQVPPADNCVCLFDQMR